MVLHEEFLLAARLRVYRRTRWEKNMANEFGLYHDFSSGPSSATGVDQHDSLKIPRSVRRAFKDQVRARRPIAGDKRKKRKQRQKGSTHSPPQDTAFQSQFALEPSNQRRAGLTGDVEPTAGGTHRR